VAQVGLHRRIGPHHVRAMEFLRSGKVGEVGMVRLFAHSGGGRERPAPNEEAPDGLDWEFWCGPAPLRPFNKKLHPGGWRHFLDYGNGTLGDWGVHWLDQVLWWAEEKYPRRVFCSGGRPIKGAPICDADQQTSDAPDHQVATYEFENFTCVWEHRQFAGNASEKHDIGAYFYGTNGVLHIGWRDGWTFHPARRSEKEIHEDARLQEPDGHNLQALWRDFLKAIDQGAQPVSGIERAHRSSVLPLLGMISWRLGRSVEWDGAREQIVGDPAANALLNKPLRAPWALPKV
jgi:predicted dehydrogenase